MRCTITGRSEHESHENEIELLPALPAAWPDGAIRGLRARGGFGVDIVWRNGKLAEAVLSPGSAAPARVRYREHIVELDCKVETRIHLPRKKEWGDALEAPE